MWVVAASGIFSILVVKQMFGGIGCNFANPALMGRLFTMVVWPGAVMQYVAPRTLAAAGFDAVSSATVLGTVKNGGEAGYSYLQMFLGETPGALGETSKLLLLVGFGYMCFMGIVNAEAALTYIATVVILTFIFGPAGLFTGDILLNLFGGVSSSAHATCLQIMPLPQEEGGCYTQSQRESSPQPSVSSVLSGGNLLRNPDSQLSWRRIVSSL